MPSVDYEKIFYGAPLPAFVLQSGLFYLVNDKMKEFTGYSAEELAGRPFTDIVDRRDQSRADILLKQNAEDFALQIVTRRGKVAYARMFFAYMELAGRPWAVGQVIDTGEQKKMEALLRESRESYAAVLESIEDGYFEVNLAGNFTYFNSALCRILGYSREELQGMNYRRYAKRSYLRRLYEAFHKVYETGKPTKLFDWEVVRKDGSTRYVETSISLINDLEKGEVTGFRGIVRDITERKRAEESLQRSEARYRDLVKCIPAVVCELTPGGKVLFVNDAVYDITGYRPEELLHRNWWDIFYPGEQRRQLDALFQHFRTGDVKDYEMTLTAKDGYVKTLIWNSANRYRPDGSLEVIFGIGVDITGRKRAEEKMKYLSLHDSLTGLCNRASFEQELQSLESKGYRPVGVMVFDLDVLKFVNDTLGHSAGDKLLLAAAGIIKGSLREGDVVARIGGDEFAALLPGVNEALMESISRSLRRAVEEYNAANPELPISMSVGYAVSCDKNKKLQSLVKEADNNMYREKLHRSKNARRAVVQSFMKALEARDFIKESHAERMQDLVARLAKAAGFSAGRMANLRLLAQFHDIGKVGIPDQILFKPGPLTPEEREEMQRHCEIGYRIALSSPGLAVIAEWILKHHEWWNGAGYPLGLKGEEIPLECRILAIADAYDAMTSDRPYRKAMPRNKAVAEIQNGAGTQFDFRLVRLFVQLIK